MRYQQVFWGITLLAISSISLLSAATPSGLQIVSRYNLTCVRDAGVVQCRRLAQGQDESGGFSSRWILDDHFAKMSDEILGEGTIAISGGSSLAVCATVAGKVKCYADYDNQELQQTFADLDSVHTLEGSRTAMCAIDAKKGIRCYEAFPTRVWGKDGTCFSKAPTDKDALLMKINSFYGCIYTASGKTKCWGCKPGTPERSPDQSDNDKLVDQESAAKMNAISQAFERAPEKLSVPNVRRLGMGDTYVCAIDELNQARCSTHAPYKYLFRSGGEERWITIKNFSAELEAHIQDSLAQGAQIDFLPENVYALSNGQFSWVPEYPKHSYQWLQGFDGRKAIGINNGCALDRESGSIGCYMMFSRLEPQDPFRFLFPFFRFEFPDTALGMKRLMPFVYPSRATFFEKVSDLLQSENTSDASVLALNISAPILRSSESEYLSKSAIPHFEKAHSKIKSFALSTPANKRLAMRLASFVYDGLVDEVAISTDSCPALPALKTALGKAAATGETSDAQKQWDAVKTKCLNSPGPAQGHEWTTALETAVSFAATR